MNTNRTTNSTRPPIAAPMMRMRVDWETPLSSPPSLSRATAVVGTEIKQHQTGFEVGRVKQTKLLKINQPIQKKIAIFSVNSKNTAAWCKFKAENLRA